MTAQGSPFAVGDGPTSVSAQLLGRAPAGSPARFLGPAAFVLAAAFIYVAGSDYWLYVATMAGIYGIVTVSQEWLFGRAGQISLGAAATMAVGAYTTALLSVHDWAIFPIPLVVSFVLGGAVGLLVGLPGLRLTGFYLMLTTLALQFIVSFVGERMQGVEHEAGYLVRSPYWGGLRLNDIAPLFVITAVVLGLTLVMLDGMFRSLPGRAWGALRQNETAAVVLGVSVVRWKLVAYVGSSAFTAMAGGLFAYQVSAVSYTSFSLDLSLALLIMVFVGGIGTRIGPLLGAAVVVVLPRQVQSFSTSVAASNADLSTWLNSNQAFLASAIYGALLLFVLLFERRGLVGICARLLSVSRKAGSAVSRRRPDGATGGGSHV